MSERFVPPEPTGDQCNNQAIIHEDDDCLVHAIWYPSMGGYVGKSAAVFSKHHGCIDVFVWHNGEFPFDGNDGDPVRIHHCDPSQFIDFGKFLDETSQRMDAE